MCGIAAIVTARSDVDLTTALERMLPALRHRGPDGSGTMQIPVAGGWRIGLAHTRLAILDPTDAGRQPMPSHCGRLTTTFNGEIYNHLDLRRSVHGRAWRSGCDTETLLELWARHGEDSLQQLRGMFALAMVDSAQRQVWFVRDRLGVKPLFLAHPDPLTWVCASEVRAILASGLVAPRIDPAVVHEYLSLGSVAAPRTLLEGIESLQAGELLRFDLSSPQPVLSRKNYWSPAFVRRDSNTRLDPRAAAREIQTAFSTAATSHLISDVPIGVFLSSGIDSGALVEAVTRHHESIHTYTVSFADRSFDESAGAAATARLFGTTHHSLVVSAADVLARLPDVFDCYDLPSFDGINTWLISRIVREAGIKVALSGLGGDELFAGYGYHRLMARLDRASRRWPMRLATSGLLRCGRGGIRAEKLHAAAAARTYGERYFALRRLFSTAIVDDLLLDKSCRKTSPADRLLADVETLDPVNAFSALDMRFYMQNTLLHDTDQMSMAHGLEVRVPFLDHKFVETMASIPGPLKLPYPAARHPKALLVASIPRPLPREITHRPKTGFVLPWGCWLRNELRPFVRERLQNSRAARLCGLDFHRLDAWEQRFQAHDPRIRESDILCLTSLLSWAERTLGSQPLPTRSPPQPIATVRDTAA